MNNPLSTRILKSTFALVAILALAAGLAVPAPAEAGVRDWLFGAAFNIGRIGFHIGFIDHGHGHRGYYYRTPERLSYRGYQCTDACYHRGSYNYHSASCPVVQRHLGVNGYDAYDVFDRYAPRSPYRGGYDRYDRNYRNDDYRYDQRGSYRGNRGYKYDRHDNHRRYIDRYHYRQGGHLRHNHRGSCNYR